MENVQLYPTLELVNRLYPPPGYAERFPVVVDITLDDLRTASEGTLVTRVIYLEDPQTPTPHTIPYREEQPSFDVLPQEDPFAVADELGRPMAIIRIGSRTLDNEASGNGITCHAQPYIPLHVGQIYERGPELQSIEELGSDVEPSHDNVVPPSSVAPPNPADVPLNVRPVPLEPAASMPHDVGAAAPLIARPVPHLRRKLTR
jgi:hypothetical protein